MVQPLLRGCVWLSRRTETQDSWSPDPGHIFHPLALRHSCLIGEGDKFVTVKVGGDILHMISHLSEPCVLILGHAVYTQCGFYTSSGVLAVWLTSCVTLGEWL